MKLNLPDVPTVNSISTINSNFAKIEEELQNKVLYRDNPSGEPNTLNTDIDANGKAIYNASAVRTTEMYIDGERVVPSGVIVVEGGVDPSTILLKANNLSDVQSAASSRVNIGLGNVDNTSDANKPVSSAVASALAAKQNTLVSGTNIKTINGNSVIGSGDLVLTGVGETNTTSNLGTGVGLAATKSGVNLPFKSLIAGSNVTIVPSTNDVTINATVDTSTLLVKSNNLSDVQSASTSRANLGLGNVDNTSDVNKPVSTATVSALSAKQSTLVSGTNIKTINGNSILGSGDLTIAGGGGGSGPFPSVLDLGVTGNGTTDDAGAIQAALTANAGGTLYFPKPFSSYKLNSSIAMPSPAVNLIMGPGVVFSGSGSMPTLTTNAAHQLKNVSYFHTVATGGAIEAGNQTLAAEIDVSNSYIGNAVGFFAGARTPTSGSFGGFIWAMNTVTRFNAGTFTGNGVGYELDLDNFNSAGKGQGLLVTGVGTYPCEVGAVIQRADTTSDWQTGVRVKNFSIGVDIAGASSSSPQVGLQITGVEKDLIKLAPRSDSNQGDAIMYIANAAQSQVKYKVTKRGGIQIGPGGAEILGHLSGTANLIWGSMIPNGTLSQTLSVPGVSPGDTIVVTPNSALGGPYFWNAWCDTSNLVTIQLINASASSGTPSTQTWRADVWKH